MNNLSEAVHLEPIWRDRANFIIAAEIEPFGTGKESEQLWARKIDENHFELCCIPFFTYHLALGDVVRTDAVGERPYMVTEVTKPSGRFVFRVYFANPGEPRADILRHLESLGGLMEWSSTKMVAVDATASNGDAIADFLEECAVAGRLMWEHGKTE